MMVDNETAAKAFIDKLVRDGFPEPADHLKLLLDCQCQDACETLAKTVSTTKHGLELVETDALIDEISRRHDHCIVAGLKIASKDQQLTTRFAHGDAIYCAGLGHLMSDFSMMAMYNAVAKTSKPDGDEDVGTPHGGLQ